MDHSQLRKYGALVALTPELIKQILQIPSDMYVDKESDTIFFKLRCYLPRSLDEAGSKIYTSFLGKKVHLDPLAEGQQYKLKGLEE